MIKFSPPELLRRLLLDFNLLNSHVRVHGSCLLDCLCQSLVVINRVTVRLDGNLLLHPCFNNSILFRLVLKCKDKISILLYKNYFTKNSNKLNLIGVSKIRTVIVSTVRVLLLMVCELTISPDAVYEPSADSRATLRLSVCTSGTCMVLWGGTNWFTTSGS